MHRRMAMECVFDICMCFCVYFLMHMYTLASPPASWCRVDCGVYITLWVEISTYWLGMGSCDQYSWWEHVNRYVCEMDEMIWCLQWLAAMRKLKRNPTRASDCINQVIMSYTCGSIYLYHLIDVDTRWWLVKQAGNTILYYPFVRSHCAWPWYITCSAALYPMRASLSFHDTTIWLIFNH